MSFETQKVSETEVLDTLGESVNVLVEDSGKFKRVPAKNLATKQAQPDLSQNDPEAADYVRGVIRQESLPEGYPYVKLAFETIVWDGNTDGRDSAEQNGRTYYKVSDQVLTAEQLIGSTVLVSGVSENDVFSQVGLPESFLVTSEMVKQPADGVCAVENTIPQIISSSVLDWGASMVLPSPGTYVMYVAEGTVLGNITFTAPVFCSELRKEDVTTIDTKFLPRASEFGAGAVNLQDIRNTMVSDVAITIGSTSYDDFNKYIDIPFWHLSYNNAGYFVYRHSVYTGPDGRAGYFYTINLNANSPCILSCVFDSNGVVSGINVDTDFTLISPSGKAFKITVDDNGTLSATEVTE